MDLIMRVVEHEGVSYPLSMRGEEPLVRDLDLAMWLGFDRPRDIRKLIERHLPSLGEVSRHRGAKPPSPSGGRPEEGYLLTEAQALYLIAKSETAKAHQVLVSMIAVFIQVRRGQQTSFDYAGLARQVAELRAEVASMRMPPQASAGHARAVEGSYRLNIAMERVGAAIPAGATSVRTADFVHLFPGLSERAQQMSVAAGLRCLGWCAKLQGRERRRIWLPLYVNTTRLGGVQ